MNCINKFLILFLISIAHVLSDKGSSIQVNPCQYMPPCRNDADCHAPCLKCGKGPTRPYGFCLPPQEDKEPKKENIANIQNAKYYRLDANCQCVNGDCSKTGNSCICHEGWSGEVCDKPECEPKCGQGECSSPNVCACNSGWKGPQCDQAICSAPCKHGQCTSPNVCSCDPHFVGSQCNECQRG